MLHKRAGKVAAFGDISSSKKDVPNADATPVKGAIAFNDIAPFKYGGGWNVSVTVSGSTIVISHFKTQYSQEGKFNLDWELCMVLSKNAITMRTAFVMTEEITWTKTLDMKERQKISKKFKYVM